MRAVLLHNLGRVADAAAAYHRVLDHPGSTLDNRGSAANNLALIESDQRPVRREPAPPRPGRGARRRRRPVAVRVRRAQPGHWCWPRAGASPRACASSTRRRHCSSGRTPARRALHRTRRRARRPAAAARVPAPRGPRRRAAGGTRRAADGRRGPADRRARGAARRRRPRGGRRGGTGARPVPAAAAHGVERRVPWWSRPRRASSAGRSRSPCSDGPGGLPRRWTATGCRRPPCNAHLVAGRIAEELGRAADGAAAPTARRTSGPGPVRCSCGSGAPRRGPCRAAGGPRRRGAASSAGPGWPTWPGTAPRWVRWSCARSRPATASSSAGWGWRSCSGPARRRGCWAGWNGPARRHCSPWSRPRPMPCGVSWPSWPASTPSWRRPCGRPARSPRSWWAGRPRSRTGSGASPGGGRRRAPDRGPRCRSPQIRALLGSAAWCPTACCGPTLVAVRRAAARRARLVSLGPMAPTCGSSATRCCSRCAG